MNLSQASELVKELLGKRAGPFSPIRKLFEPHLDELKEATGLPNGTLDAIIHNSLTKSYGSNVCEICGKETSFHKHRGWSKYCSKKCMNSSDSSRHKNSEITKSIRGTAINSDAVRIKSAQTLHANYGVENPSKNYEICEKRKNTFVERYGVESAFCLSAFRQKGEQTQIEKYGGIGNSSPIIRERKNNTVRSQMLIQLKERLPEWEIHDITWETGKLPIASLTHNCGTSISKDLGSGQYLFNPICPKCHGSSNPQKKIIDLLNELGETFSVNDRKIIRPQELDILIPSKRIAIEVNGVYYHGEKFGRGKKYHLDKTVKCQEAGFQLLHFLDLEIENNWNAVKHTIMSKLGYLEKLDARKCEIKDVSSTDAVEFANRFHMQQSCQSSIRLGLFFKGDLVSLMTFGKARYNKSYNFELLRFVSKANVRGAASKLLARFSQMHPGSTIISYADRRWSNGQMYKKLGFEFIGNSPPGYRYFKNSKLYHRTQFQRHKLSDDSSLTESEIMLARGFDKIWDCGTLKFIFKT